MAGLDHGGPNLDEHTLTWKSWTILPQVLIFIVPYVDPMRITSVTMKCEQICMIFSDYTYAKAENQN